MLFRGEQTVGLFEKFSIEKPTEENDQQSDHDGGSKVRPHLGAAIKTRQQLLLRI